MVWLNKRGAESIKAPCILRTYLNLEGQNLRVSLHDMDDQHGAEEVAAKLRTALEMFGLGESIMRQKLRRTYPNASEAEIEAKVWAWLSERPGAEHGDAPGRRRDLVR